jgi:hypothetical protein
MPNRDIFEAFDEPAAPEIKGGVEFAPDVMQAFEKGSTKAEPTAISTIAAPLTGFNIGMADILGAPIDVTSWALKKAGVPTGPAPYGGSESIKQLGRKALEVSGLRQIEPRSREEELLQSFGKGVAGAVIPAVGLEAAAPRIAPRVLPYLQDIFGARAPGLKPMAELGTLGGAGAVGADIATEMAPERLKPTAGLVGGLVGGGLAATGMGAASKVPYMARVARDYLDPMSAAGVEREAARKMGQLVTSPEETIKRIEKPGAEIVKGSQPTLFELTGDTITGQAQRQAETLSPDKFIKRRQDQNAARVKLLSKIAPEGGITDLPVHIRQQLEMLDEGHENLIRVAEENARQEVAALGGASTPDEYGRIMREHLEATKEAARQERERLYDLVDPKNKLNLVTRPVVRKASLLSRIGPKAQPLSSTERDLYEKAMSFGDVGKFRDLRDLDKYLTSAMSAEKRAAGESESWGRMVQLKKAVLDSIENSLRHQKNLERRWAAAGKPSSRMRPTMTPEEAASLRQAKDQHIVYKTKYSLGPVGEVLRTRGFTGQYRTPNAAVVGKFFPAGDKGYEAAMSFRNAIGDETKALSVMEDYISWSLRNEALDANGVVDPLKFASWRRRHAEALRAFPELATKYDRAVNAAEHLEDVAIEKKRAINEYQTNAVKGLIGVNAPEDVTRVVGRIFGAKDAVAQMSALAAEAKKNPDAFEGLRRAVAEFINGKFISNTEAGTSGENLLRSDQFQTFIRNNKAALSTVFDPKEIKSLVSIAADLHRANRSISSTALPGRSTTAQDLLPAIKEGKVSGLKGLAEAVAGAGGLGTLATQPFTGAGLLISAIGHHFFDAARQSGLKNANDIVVEALLNPELAAKLLKKIPPTPRKPDYDTMQALRRVPVYGILGTTMPPERRAFASGGAAGRAMTADMMIKAAERSKKKIQEDTKPILEESDEHVVKALRVANQHI